MDTTELLSERTPAGPGGIDSRATRQPGRRPSRPARRRGSGGPDGNERLTGTTAAALLVLLTLEGVTLLSLRSLLSMHVFVGMLLVPPVALKLGSTGYRFLRYYTGSPHYRRKGPPAPLLRLLAPAVVLSTVVLFATGIVLVVAGPPSGALVGLHKASFAVWLATMAVHVLAHARRVPRLTTLDWRRGDAISGSGLRRFLLAGALVGGLGLAAATVGLAAPWIARIG